MDLQSANAALLTLGAVDRGGLQTIHVEIGEGRSQIVVLETFHADASIWLELRSACAGRDKISAEAALRRNARLTEGTLCFDGDHCVLRSTQPLSSLDTASLQRWINAVAHRADELEREFCADDTF